MSRNPLKKCPKCSDEFFLSDLLTDPDLELIGMTFENQNPKFNCYYFNHITDNCGTTFVIPIKDVESRLGWTVNKEILAGKPGCEGHCLDLKDHEVCRQQCRWAPFRHLLQKLLAKKPTTDPACRTETR